MKDCPYSESELLEIAQRFKKHLKDLMLVPGLDPELNQDFVYRFKARFYEAQAHAHPHPLDAAADQKALHLKEELEVLTEQIRSVFRVFRFNIQKACPYGSEIWDTYGYSNLEYAHLDYEAFQSYLTGFLKLANEKMDDLQAANCPTHDLEEIAVLAQLFNHKHEELAEYVERKEIREQVYNTNINELFKLMKMINNVASGNLHKNPETLKNLLFPPKAGSL